MEAWEVKHRNKFRFNVESNQWEIWDDFSASTWDHCWRTVADHEIRLIPEEEWTRGLELFIRLNKHKLKHFQNYQEPPKEMFECYSKQSSRDNIKEFMLGLKDDCFDLKIQYGDDRVAKVLAVIGDKELGIALELLEEIESERYVQKHGHKNKNSYLAETDYISQGIESIANYILSARYYNPLHQAQMQQQNGEAAVYSTVSREQLKKDKKQVSWHAIGCMEQTGLYSIDRPTVQEMPEVDSRDTLTYPLLALMMKDIECLKEKLGYGQGASIRESKRKIIQEEYIRKASRLSDFNLSDLTPVMIRYKKPVPKPINDNSTLHSYDRRPAQEYNQDFDAVDEMTLPRHQRIGEGRNHHSIGFPSRYHANYYYNEVRKLYSAVSFELKLIKELLRTPMNISKAMQSTLHDYDYLQFNFSDAEQVQMLLKLYHELAGSSVQAVAILLEDLNDYIQQTQFDEVERMIIELLKSGFKVSEVISIIVQQFQYPAIRVRRMINHAIPKKITETYERCKDDYMMRRYHIKGKRCSVCGQVKLACRRNFHRDRKSKDGIGRICKECESLYKSKIYKNRKSDKNH